MNKLFQNQKVEIRNIDFNISKLLPKYQCLLTLYTELTLEKIVLACIPRNPKLVILKGFTRLIILRDQGVESYLVDIIETDQEFFSDN